MPGDNPDGFVLRRAEYKALKEAVLAAPASKLVALTTALVGAGGYGKTVLANVLCRDDDIRFEFTDGILRAEVGKERGDVTGLVIDLIEKLDPESKRPGFQDIVTASEHLGELIGEARILLVIDDVWREAQLRPFLRGGPHCVRLVTTRLPHVLPAGHIPISIDEMRASEAISLLSGNLSGAENPLVRRRLAALADRLGFWAQMLGIANGWLRNRVAAGEPINDAIRQFERRLDAYGLTAFDPRDEPQRNRAIRACVEASLEDLSDSEIARLSELAVLPEEENVPLGVVAGLWRETGKVNEDEADDLIERFHALSLLQNLDLRNRTLRLHDNMIWYLRHRIGPQGYTAAHAAMVGALQAASGGHWTKLPADHVYGWRFLIWHLRAAGKDNEVDRVLTDYAWIKAKLRTCRPRDLYESYLPESANESVRLIGRAVALSLPALAANPRELARQIFGRLGNIENATAASIVAAAREDSDFQPAPRWPGLTPPGAERLRLVGNGASVRSAVFSRDGTRILTASNDFTARVWDATTGRELSVLRGHTAGPDALPVFSPNGDYVLTASWEGTAQLRDVETGVVVQVLGGKKQIIYMTMFSSDGNRIFLGCWGPSSLWEVSTGLQISELPGVPSTLFNADFSPDGTRILTADPSTNVRLWDVASGAQISEMEGDIGVFSPDGTRILTGSKDGTARLWDATTGTEIAVLHGYSSGVNYARFSADGNLVLISDWTTARLWDVKTRTGISTLCGHTDQVCSAVFSPDRTRILTASWDNTARLWDATTGTQMGVLEGHDGWVWTAVFSPDGTRIVTASQDHTARLWDAEPRKVTSAPHGHRDQARWVAISGNGTRVVTISGELGAQLWDATSGKEIRRLVEHEGPVYSAVFSPEGTYILIASAEGTSRLWDASTGKEKGVLRGHEREVADALFSADGTRILTASQDNTVRVWDAKCGRQISILSTHQEIRRGDAAFSPDTTRLLTISSDVVQVWDATTGIEISALNGHSAFVTSAVFSADGTRILTASQDATVRLWDASSGEQIVELCGHELVLHDREYPEGVLCRVNTAVFSVDGTLIVTASQDRTARVWDASTGKEKGVLRGHESEVVSAVFSADGTRILTASWDDTFRLWDATTATQISAHRAHEVHGLAIFSPDGRRVLLCCGDGTVRVADAITGKQITQIAFDAVVTRLAVGKNTIVLGDRLGRFHSFTTQELLR